jgi:hypothetical protein
MTDPVADQVAAYNAHDVNAFVRCFHEDVIVSSPDGSVRLEGSAELRARYGALFEHGTAHAEIVERVRAGNWVVDHERVTGVASTTVEVLVAHQVDGERIHRMILLG